MGKKYDEDKVNGFGTYSKNPTKGTKMSKKKAKDVEFNVM